MKMRIPCPECHNWNVTTDVSAESWTCNRCGYQITAQSAAPPPDQPLETCRSCGNHGLYVQKDFPHWLGMGILVAACIASVITYAMHQITMTWVILIGSAAIDGLLYLAMGNVTVCYRCRTHYRGFPPSEKVGPFNLAVGEKYRQERLRREELGGRK
jgi:uncharacterized protein (DUF983 family)